MKHEIVDNLSPILNITLSDGESVFTTDVSAAWLTTNFDVKTGARGALGSRVTGDALTATTYTCNEGMGTVTFTMPLPGAIVEYALKPTSSVVVQQGSFLVAESSVRSTGVKNKRLETGFYGSEGYGVQRLSGPGTMFAYALGGVVERQLEPNEQLWVEPALIVMYEATIGFDIVPVKGAANLAVSANDRLHHAALKGPGKVWLQLSSRATLNALGTKYT
jgi:uncharacterized protein (AIM24 family)